MKSMTIKQKLIGMNIILALMVAGLSVFFINRFGVMSYTYRRISEARVPQLEVADAMAQVILNNRVNMNEVLSVQRDFNNYETFARRAEAKLVEFKALEQALLHGSKDLGTRNSALTGVSVPPCRKGGKIEALLQQSATLFAQFEALCRNILAIKKQELESVNRVGWYDSQEDAKGAVRTLVETGRKMAEAAQDEKAKFLVAEIRRQEKNLLHRADQRYIDRLKEAYDGLAASSGSEQIHELGKTYRKAFEGILEDVLQIARLRDTLKALIRKDLRDKQKALDEAVTSLRDRAHEQMVNASNEAMALEKTAKWWIMVISLAVVILSLGFGWFVSSGINKALNRIIENLNSGSEEVVSASGQVSAASQSLAEGASEQAAAIEETASSLEEMASMTQQNAVHASQADTLMKEAHSIVGRANVSMEALTSSMDEISRKSDETSKIIKTVDEIAFQTNLLALNAAVEAARAGEAGAGFAVVADEVRNLAMRAAEAAKTTAVLIEDTVTRVNDGTALVTSTNENFRDVEKSAGRVADLVSEIAAASNEQSQGIEQVNKAVAEMDKVVQQNAANAEESASASEELNGQAEEMKQLVEDLVAMVGGGGNDRRADARREGLALVPARLRDEG